MASSAVLLLCFFHFDESMTLPCRSVDLCDFQMIQPRMSFIVMNSWCYAVLAIIILVPDKVGTVQKGKFGGQMWTRPVLSRLQTYNSDRDLDTSSEVGLLGIGRPPPASADIISLGLGVNWQFSFKIFFFLVSFPFSLPSLFLLHFSPCVAAKLCLPR